MLSAENDQTLLDCETIVVGRFASYKRWLLFCSTPSSTSLLRPRPNDLSPAAHGNATPRRAASVEVVAARVTILVHIPGLALAGSLRWVFLPLSHLFLLLLPFFLPFPLALHLTLQQGFRRPAAGLGLLL